MTCLSQQPPSQTAAAAQCRPISQKTSELGCWILADLPVSPITEAQAFWHLDIYPTRDAANAVKGPHGVVAGSFGKNWLLTIETASWQAPAGGDHVAKIGPLPLPAAEGYTAACMESVFAPGINQPFMVILVLMPSIR